MKLLGPTCKNCRRFEVKLCGRPPGKCAWEKRASRFSKFGAPSRRNSQYRLQLIEKQKAKFIYNITERQFRNYYRNAARQRGVTGDILLSLLESRFDNVIFRLGFAKSRAQARQNVTHGHYRLNGRKLNLPACQVKAGDTIEWRDKTLAGAMFEGVKESMQSARLPDWLKRDGESKKGEVVAAPYRQDEAVPLKTSLIVEYYSRR